MLSLGAAVRQDFKAVLLEVNATVPDILFNAAVPEMPPILEPEALTQDDSDQAPTRGTAEAAARPLAPERGSLDAAGSGSASERHQVGSVHLRVGKKLEMETHFGDQMPGGAGEQQPEVPSFSIFHPACDRGRGPRVYMCEPLSSGCDLGTHVHARTSIDAHSTRTGKQGAAAVARRLVGGPHPAGARVHTKARTHRRLKISDRGRWWLLGCHTPRLSDTPLALRKTKTIYTHARSATRKHRKKQSHARDRVRTLFHRLTPTHCPKFVGTWCVSLRCECLSAQKSAMEVAEVSQRGAQDQDDRKAEEVGRYTRTLTRARAHTHTQPHPHARTLMEKKAIVDRLAKLRDQIKTLVCMPKI